MTLCSCTARTAWCVACMFVVTSAVNAAEVVRSSVSKRAAWTGEPVPIIVTLYSPGPFSGTASFDLPELPQTIIVVSDRPVIGSEQIDGETYFTQRHTLTLYTQKAGEIVVPPLVVRFAGRPTFTADPEPMQGETDALRFQSNRPPVSGDLGMIIAANSMEVRQEWSSEDSDWSAGDVILRTIHRTASGTTAMMMPPVPVEVLPGVRIYSGEPMLQDRQQRGESDSVRTEVLKYQFEKPGVVELPELEFAWWDVEAEALKTETLPGRTIVVNAVQAESVYSSGEPSPFVRNSTALLLLCIAVAAFLLRIPITALVASYRAGPVARERTAAKQVRRACRRNDAKTAYAAILDWQRACYPAWKPLHTVTVNHQDFQDDFNTLSRTLFGSSSNPMPWSGAGLLRSFNALHRDLRSRAAPAGAASVLPPLNQAATVESDVRVDA